MKPLHSIEEIRNLIADVRNKRLGFITNFYLDEYKHTVWIQNGCFFYENIGNTLFLVKKSDTFINLFYNSTSSVALCCDLKSFKLKYFEMVTMVDVVGRESQCSQMLELLKPVSFSEATSLSRMIRFTESMEYSGDSAVSVASLAEVNEINDLLHKFFDEKTEQIPYIDELYEYAKLGHILVCHQDGQLAGFVIYEMNSTTQFLRYWFTHPDFRNKKVGSRLLRKFFEDGKNTKRQLLWVLQSNKNAIMRYLHYGFKEEDMKDYVLRIN